MRRLRRILLPLLCFSAAGWRGHAPLTVRGSRARAAVRAAAWERRPHPSPWRSPINVEAPGINGGDPWAGARGTDEDVKLVVDEAMSQTVVAPVMQQFYPQRDWLWSRWTGTIVARVLTREVLWTSLFAALFIVAFGRISAAATAAAAAASRKHAFRAAASALGSSPATAAVELAATALASVDKVWMLASSLVSFTLSFFLTQSYTFWREIYVRCRIVQGRLNDLGLLLASNARRHESGPAAGEYTDESREMLVDFGRYARLFHMLLYASLTGRYAVLRTPRGLSELMRRGALTQPELNALLQSSMGHNAVFTWMAAVLNAALSDGRLCGSSSGGSAAALQISLQNKLCELRAAFAGIEDQLTGRMPLAYTQLVQIMVDLLIGFTPLALIHSVGGVGAVFGTAAWSRWPSWRRHSWPPRAPQAASEGVRLPSLSREKRPRHLRSHREAVAVPREARPPESTFPFPPRAS